jgi:hypothetical protein
MTDTAAAASDPARIAASLAHIRRRRNLRRGVLAAFLAVPAVAALLSHAGSCMDFVTVPARWIFTTTFGVTVLTMIVNAVRERRADEAALAKGGPAALAHHRTRLDRAIRATSWLRLSWFVAVALAILFANANALHDGNWELGPEAAGLIFAAFLNGVVVHRRYFLRPRFLRERSAIDEVKP